MAEMMPEPHWFLTVTTSLLAAQVIWLFGKFSRLFSGGFLTVR